MKLVPWNSGMSLGDVWIPMRDNWFLDSAVKGCWHTSQAQTYSDSSGAVSIPIWAFGEDIRRKARFTEGAARNFLGFTVLSEVSDRHGTQDTMPPALALKLKSIWHRMEQFPWPALGKISNPAGISASTLGFFLAGLPLAPCSFPPPQFLLLRLKRPWPQVWRGSKSSFWQRESGGARSFSGLFGNSQGQSSASRHWTETCMTPVSPQSSSQQQSQVTRLCNNSCYS